MTLFEAPWFRAVASVGANLIRGGVSFATGLAVARVLGATRYGDLAFLIGTFAALTLLLDFGTTSAFYTMLATRRRGPRFFIAYAAWTIGVQLVVTSLVIAFVLPEGAIRRIWISFDRPLILLSLASSFVVTQVWTTVTQMAEAVRKTVFIQAMATVQVVVHLALVIAAIRLDNLSLPLLLILPIAEYALLAILLMPSLLRLNLERANVDVPRAETFRDVISEFSTYCRPLVAYSMIGFIYHFADRWFLQRFGGAAQQGYFAIGQQFANVANLVTASILAVIWKEVAESFGRNDLKRARDIFGGVRRGLFFLSAAVSALLLPNVALMLRTIVGGQYAAASLCVSLMFLYPIHQAIGQFQGTFLLATGATAAYSIIGIGSMLISIPIAYMMIAPATANPPGLGWGAVGLAVKLVILQLIAVTLQFWALRRQHGFRWQWKYEIAVVSSLLALSFGVHTVCGSAMSLLGFGGHDAVIAIVGALIYCSVLALVVLRYPHLLGVTSGQRDAIVCMARRALVRAA